MAKTWTIGEAAPNFKVRSTNNPNFNFDVAAGRYIVLSFLGSVAIHKSRAALQHMLSRTDFFDDVKASFFGVSVDVSDEATGRMRQIIPGFRFFWDFDKMVSVLYGAVNEHDIAATDKLTYHPFTLVLDPTLRVIAHIPISNPDLHNKALDEIIANLPPVNDYAGVEIYAPVLIVPNVFEPDFCKELISLYQQNHATDSGFVRDENNQTVGLLDNNFKRRRDFNFDVQAEYEPLRRAMQKRLIRHLFPQIKKAFQFEVTRIERYVIACYDSEFQGFFRPHRDNTTIDTAHRKFACTLNLNTGEYEGGALRFPEYGDKQYVAPLGGAVVFSCSLLHEAMPVTRGIRFATLPFMYDEEGAAIRQNNLAKLSFR
jgi:predicted 2-oxoglutarate/Fe(II)-dependent dioxygenase YbiX/peroxiredoxin